MSKVPNESLAMAQPFGNQLRYVSRRRLRKLKARARRTGQPLAYEQAYGSAGRLWTWLKPLEPSP